MAVKNLGFFRDFPHGDPGGPSLTEAVGKGDEGLQGRLAAYLQEGAVLGATPQRVRDVLSAEERDAGPLAVVTDGSWLWPADLPYYVREYNIALPEEFVAHAASLGWTPPALSRDDLIAIEGELFPGE